MRTALSYSCWMLQWGNTCLVVLFVILKWTGNLDFIWYKRIVIKYWQNSQSSKKLAQNHGHILLWGRWSPDTWFAARLGVGAWWGLEAAVHVLCARHFWQSTLIIFVFYVCDAGCWIQSLCLLRVCSVNNQAKFLASLMPCFPCYETRHHLWRHLLVCIGLHK